MRRTLVLIALATMIMCTWKESSESCSDDSNGGGHKKGGRGLKKRGKGHGRGK